MASLTITLNGNKSELNSDFFPPIELNNGEYVIGLINFETFHSIPNVDETNNKFYYYIDNKLRTFTIPIGSYEI